jgi:hypothetical protein
MDHPLAKREWRLTLEQSGAMEARHGESEAYLELESVDLKP